MLGIAEIAELAGVSRQAVWQWTNSKSAKFPDPVLRLAMGPVFSAKEVREWLETRHA